MDNKLYFCAHNAANPVETAMADAVVPLFRVAGTVHDVRDKLDGDSVCWETRLAFASAGENETLVSVMLTPSQQHRFTDWGGAWEPRMQTMTGDWNNVLEMRGIRVLAYIEWWANGQSMHSYLAAAPS